MLTHCRRMVATEESRVDFGMAEALALGALALHRGRRPRSCEFGIDAGDQPGAPTEARAALSVCKDMRLCVLRLHRGARCRLKR